MSDANESAAEESSTPDVENLVRAARFIKLGGGVVEAREAFKAVERVLEICGCAE